MEQRIIADGENICRNSPKLKEKLEALRASVKARYAERLSSANLLQRLLLRWRIEMEYRRERRSIVPSSAALYQSHKN
jgi:hypothetical protein